MASSYKCVVIALLVVFSNLRPSAAIRSADPEAATSTPSSRRHLRRGELILLDICHALFPPPTPPSPPSPEERVTCRAPLAKRFVPVCGSFLTNSSVSAPSSECCYRVSSFIATPTQFCLCHIANGDETNLYLLNKLRSMMDPPSPPPAPGKKA
uniref:Bifunctional inhibitor/plant lipid transfer protein/seed storage helical domain-containing protein n=1 Tax=Setaria italica TaxID=4555 RepID=K3YDH8_SETIT